MRSGARFAVKWALLGALALALGGALGAWYALEGPAAAVEDGAPSPLGGWGAVEPDRTPPTTPAPLTPGDGELVNTTMPRFTWTRAEDPDPVLYVLQFANDPDFQSVMTVANVYQTEWQTPRENAFPPLLRVYWRVLAVDMWNNESPWSDVYTFTPVAPPDVPHAGPPTTLQ